MNLYVPVGRLLNIEKPILGVGVEVRTEKKMAISIDYGLGIHLPDFKLDIAEVGYTKTSNWFIQRFDLQIKHFYRKVYSQKKQKKWNNKTRINKAKKQSFYGLEFVFAPESYKTINGSFFDKGSEAIYFNNFTSINYSSTSINRTKYILAFIKGYRKAFNHQPGFVEVAFSFGAQKINIQYTKIIPPTLGPTSRPRLTISNWHDQFDGRFILPYLNFNLAFGF